jgi:predicted nicotinamide N-methyase
VERKVNIVQAQSLQNPEFNGSILLGQVLLQQLHGTSSQDTLLNKQALSVARVLELGSGTGLLGLILAPFTGHHTCTDLPELLALIKKNIVLNAKILSECPGRLSYEALNWNDVHVCSPAARERVFLNKNSTIRTEGGDSAQGNDIGFDLILVVDCVYNPSLIPPLLTTIDLYTVPGRTAVLVVMELRDEDVLREFLTQWIGMPGWEVRPVGNEGHPPFLDERFAMWIGFKDTKLSN